MPCLWNVYVFGADFPFGVGTLHYLWNGAFFSVVFPFCIGTLHLLCNVHFRFCFPFLCGNVHFSVSFSFLRGNNTSLVECASFGAVYFFCVETLLSGGMRFSTI